MRAAMVVMIGTCLLASPAMGAGGGVEARPPSVSQLPSQVTIKVRSAAEARARRGDLNPVNLTGASKAALSLGQRLAAFRSAPRVGGTRAPAATRRGPAAPAGSGTTTTPPAGDAGVKAGSWATTTYQALPEGPYATGAGVVLSAVAPADPSTGSCLTVLHAKYTAATTAATGGVQSVVQFTHLSTAPIFFLDAWFDGLPTGSHTYMLILGSNYDLVGDRVEIRLVSLAYLTSTSLRAPNLVADPANSEIRALFRYDHPGVSVLVRLEPVRPDRPGRPEVTRRFYYLQLVQLD